MQLALAHLPFLQPSQDSSSSSFPRRGDAYIRCRRHVSDPNATVDGNSRPSTPTPNSNAAASAVSSSRRLRPRASEDAHRASRRANDPSAFIDRRTASSVVSIRLSTTPHSHAAAFESKSCAKTFRIAATSAGAEKRVFAALGRRPIARATARATIPRWTPRSCSNAPRVARVAVSGDRNAVATSKHAPVALRRLFDDASTTRLPAGKADAAPVIVVASMSRSPSPSPRELAWSTVARASAHVDAARETAASDVEARTASARWRATARRNSAGGERGVHRLTPGRGDDPEE